MTEVDAELDKWTRVHKVPRRERASSDEVKERVERRMARIDALTPDVRACVHEYGWNLVDTFRQHGVTTGKSIRALVNSVVHNIVDRKDWPAQP